MIWILTEDSQSGYMFWKHITELAIKETGSVKVVNPSIMYSGAGNAALYMLYEHLITTKKIKAGDAVFLAVDRLVGTNEKMRSEVESQNRALRKCKGLAKSNGIKYIENPFICFEELLLSFMYLYEFCMIAPDCEDKMAQYYLRNRALFCGDAKVITTQNASSIMRKQGIPDYIQIFKSQLDDGKTVEACLSDLLRRLTCSVEPKLETFKFNKNTVGACWYSDCSAVVEHLSPKRRALCAECFACKKAPFTDRSNGAKRLAFVVTHSKIREITDTLELHTK